jgi:hypothetical protein
MPHLAHFGRASFNLGHAVVRWSPPLQIWHPPNMVEKNDASRLGTFPLKKLISVLFKPVTCFSIIVSETPSSCYSFNGSYGVFLSFSNTLFSFATTPTNFSMLVKSSYYA